MTQQLQEFYHSLKGMRVSVVGVGVSNAPLCELLCKHGANVTVRDKRSQEQLGELYQNLKKLGVQFFLGEDYLEDLGEELIFKTPGLRFDAPQLLRAQENGSKITSEMELFFELCPCKIIAVTGSDGKSTTTTLIYEMLKNEGVRCHLGGNIGQPLLHRIEEVQEGDIVVAELSSFQLHTMKKSPHIAVVTNVAPNHLDMHKSMEEYVDAKRNILRYQGAGDKLVLNMDNKITCGMESEANGQVVFFSRQEEVETGAYYKEDTIYLVQDGRARALLGKEDVLLPGLHNIENYMAAILAVQGLVSDEVIRHTAKTFAGLQHRLELVRELSGVRYYNDSIASSPTRTKACFEAFPQKLLLIAGGYDKHIPFDSFGEDILKHVKYLALIGVTAPLIRKAVEQAKGYREGLLEMKDCESLERAVLWLKEKGQPGDKVILSPACASFDMFQNFEKRGNAFKEIVNRL